MPLADTRRFVVGFPPDLATLRIIECADHGSVSSEAEFCGALANGKWSSADGIRAVKGRANDAVIALLADHLGANPSSIAVVSGHGSPAKVVAVEGMANEAIRAAFTSEKPRNMSGYMKRE